MSENEVLVEKEEVIDLDTVLEEVEVEVDEIETEVINEVINEEVKEVKNDTFGNGILVGVVDQIVIFAGALAAQLLFGLLLRLFGYHIVEQDKIFIIMYVIANIVYAPVCKRLKFEKTLGIKVVLKK